MKILLTGHKGFIGSHLLRLLEEQHEVICADKKENFDLCDQDLTESLPDCDVVVHLAAMNGTKLFYDMPFDVATNNLLPTVNLVNRYRNTDTKFIFASTCEIFNGATDLFNYKIPTDEKVPVVFDDILNPRWSYSLPKALGENLVANSGLNWTILRFFNIYGPGQIDHFIPEFVNRALNQEMQIIGNDTRSFCYVDDAVKITKNLIESCPNQIINVGNDEEFEIAYIARKILKIMEIDPSLLEILPGKKGSARRRCPDISILKKLTNFHTFTPIETGLKRTIASLI